MNFPDKDLLNKINSVNVERLESYLKMFDRILLYSLAVSTMSKEHLDECVKLTEKVIKKSIDIDSQMRTDYLEGSIDGRVLKMQKATDGEELRLQLLNVWKVAKELIERNLTKDYPGSTQDSDCDN